MWQKEVLIAFEKALENAEWERTIEKAVLENGWFNPENVNFALLQWREALQSQAADAFIQSYANWPLTPGNQILGLIAAGNIPLVVMHDVICGLLTGYKVQLKCSSDDAVLPKFWIEKAIEIFPALSAQIELVEKIEKPDVAIATGSNNSTRYFEYYFRNIPHLLRKNRNSAAVLHGKESAEELIALGNDVFRYFGLGCRNITHLFLPPGYDFKPLLDTWTYFSDLHLHFKFSNNYQYHKALLLMNLDPHLDNGFIVLKETPHIYAPVGMLGFSYYQNEKELKEILQENQENLQVVCSSFDISDLKTQPFGSTQCTTLRDFADNVDTVKFLLEAKG